MAKENKVKIKCIADNKRCNAYGTFEPGKVYDVKKETASKLLTCPEYFEQVGGPKVKTWRSTPVAPVEKKLKSETTENDETTEDNEKTKEQIIEDEAKKLKEEKEGKYAKYSVPELREICREKDLSPGRRGRDALIELIKANTD